MAELSRCYGVSEQSIYKLLARYRTTGSVAVQTHTRGHKSYLLDTAISLKMGDFITPPRKSDFEKENGGFDCYFKTAVH